MKLATQQLTITDVMQYYVDPVFSVKTLTFSTALAVDLPAGSAINPTTGALTSSTDTATAVVSEFTPAGSKSVPVFDKLVVLYTSAIKGADTAGTTKAIQLLQSNQFIRLI